MALGTPGGTKIFPSVAQARAFFESPEYIQAKALRAVAAEADFLILPGLPDPEH